MDNPKRELICIFFPDLLGWEKVALGPLVECLSRSFSVRLVQFESYEQVRRISAKRYVWVLAHHWEEAARMLSVTGNTNAFVSVLGIESRPSWLPGVFWKRMRSTVRTEFRVVAHSPLSYRFLSEIERIPPSRLAYLPLPFGALPLEKEKSAQPSPTVATFSRFTTESNLHYFLSVAHYVVHKDNRIRFAIYGRGGLVSHVFSMAQELGIASAIDIRQDGTLGTVDAVLFHPLQHQHFLPMVLGAGMSAPILACNVPGIEDLIQDGKDGFIVPVNETKPMGELILRILHDPILKDALAKRFCDKVFDRFSSERLAGLYGQLVLPASAPPAHVSPQAA